ncbi:hypothetical protein NEIG_00232 [Nematocida sp. ERTm5]|nr:hypothetical protein NEIG_00232 [Nematocida sp. ERTm5]
MKKCPYCFSKKLENLNETVYCDACQSYFRRTPTELVPIFIENKEIYRKYQKICERRILCTVCQERNENENEKFRAEDEQRLKLNKPIKNDTRTLINSGLCRECVERVNSKLESDKNKYYSAYKAFLIKKRISGTAVIVTAVALSKWTGDFISSIILSIYMIKELRGMESVLISFIFCFISYFLKYSAVVFSVVVFIWLFTRRRCKEIIYLKFNLDVERIQKDILRKIKGLHIGKIKESNETENLKGRSFVHTAYNQHIRQSEELDEIAKGIACLKIKDTWYGKVDRLVEWLATT